MRLILAIAVLLAGCTTAPTIVSEPYTPPRVDCIQQDTPGVPAWPTLWWIDGPAWAIETLGVLTLERELRTKEQECIAALKAKGIVR